MSIRRKLAAAVGLTVALVAFVMLVVPDLAAQLATSRNVLTVIGLLAVFQGYRAVKARRRLSIELAETGDPETEQDLPVPGDEFDELLSNMHGLRNPRVAARERRTHITRSRDRITERLETAAVATITRKYGCTEAEANRILETGEWTDDPFAAAFFSGSMTGVPVRLRLRGALSPRGQFERRANHAAREIAALSKREDVPDVELTGREDAGEVSAA